MKNIILLIFLSFIWIVPATPHYPNGIPNIGPLKGGVTFWGGEDTGEYFDGVTYSSDYKINVPNHGDVRIYIHLTHYLNSIKSRKDEKSVTLIFENPIKGFTGEINIKSINSSKKTLVRKYKGSFNGTSNWVYNSFFDFSEINENCIVTIELLLDNGKKVDIRLKGQILKDLISISEYFPEDASKKGKLILY